MLVAPSDHLIKDEYLFHDTLKKGSKEALKNKIVTFGIVPERPETGYGYIKVSEKNKIGATKVMSFVEKPGIEMAKEFIKAGDYLWNSGIFLFRTEVIIEEFKILMPDLYYSALASVEKGLKDLNFLD